jgi:hypothetical protein
MVVPAVFLKVTFPKVTPLKPFDCKLALIRKVEAEFHVAVGNDPVAKL